MVSKEDAEASRRLEDGVCDNVLRGKGLVHTSGSSDR
jgi:hypothetical protein